MKSIICGKGSEGKTPKVFSLPKNFNHSDSPFIYTSGTSAADDPKSDSGAMTITGMAKGNNTHHVSFADNNILKITDRGSVTGNLSAFYCNGAAGDEYRNIVLAR